VLGEPLPALGAPRALERADPHVQCVRRQVTITALAVRSDLQHWRLRSVARPFAGSRRALYGIRLYTDMLCPEDLPDNTRAVDMVRVLRGQTARFSP